MKRVFVLAFVAIVLVSCKPQKPWSPYDKNNTAPNGQLTTSSVMSTNQQDVDVGDVEQSVYVDGKISTESRNEGVHIKDTLDRTKRHLKTNITLDPPYPVSLWSEFQIACERDFKTSPAVLRARILVEDKVAGSIAVVLGSKAMTSKLSVKVDLLKPFEGNLPNTFLAKVEGDIYLMPEGTDENKLNPETATSEKHSRVVYGTIIRVDLAQAAAPASPAPADPAASAAPATETPAAPATETPSTSAAAPSGEATPPSPAETAPAAPAAETAAPAPVETTPAAPAQ
jgi:hypothetical protein